MSINVLGITGSPEIGGNTELLLDKTLEGCKSVKEVNIEKIVVSKLNISPCTSCRYCASAGTCRVDDDMSMVASKIIRANHIVVASPVYFLGVTAQLKALIDRCQLFWCRKYLLNSSISDGVQSERRGMYISTGGNLKENIFEGVVKTIRAFFVTIDVVCDDNDSLLISAMEEKNEILNHPHYLERAYDLGVRLVNPD